MDKDLLFKPRLPEDEIDIPGIGTVRVRGLNRAEAMRVQATKGVEATERLILSLGMVDPELTEAEAGRWQKASAAGEIEPVATRIAELSGLAPDAPKAAYTEFEADPGSEFRILPGAEAEHDGGPAERGDQQR